MRHKDPVSGRPVVVIPESDWENASQGGRHRRRPPLARQPDVGRQTSDSGSPVAGSSLSPAHRCGSVCRRNSTRRSASRSRHSAAALRHRRMLTTGRSKRSSVSRPLNAVVDSCSHRMARWPRRTRPLAVGQRLELVNHRLRLIEPWLAGGKVVGRVQSSDAAWSAALLHVDYARLLMPIPTATSTRRRSRRRPARSPARRLWCRAFPNRARSFSSRWWNCVPCRPAA